MSELKNAVTLRQAEALVGMPYVTGRFTCMHLAVWAQEQLFGRQVAHDFPRYVPAGGRHQARLVRQWRERLASPVATPETGDLVLFHDDNSDWEWHLGTVFLEQGQQWVLHTHQGLGASVLEPLADTRMRLLRVEGFYRWLREGRA